MVLPKIIEYNKAGADLLGILLWRWKQAMKTVDGAIWCLTFRQILNSSYMFILLPSSEANPTIATRQSEWFPNFSACEAISRCKISQDWQTAVSWHGITVATWTELLRSLGCWESPSSMKFEWKTTATYTTAYTALHILSPSVSLFCRPLL